MPYPNEHACRIREPIKDAQTRRVNGAREHNGKKYDVIYQKQTDGKWKDQAFRYPKKTWNASEAKSHCSSHKGSFEAASEKKDEVVQFVDEVMNRPMFITTDGYAQLTKMLLEFKDGYEPELAATVIEHQDVLSNNGVYLSIIPIQGPLVRRTSWFSTTYGLYSYNAIQHVFRQALEDPRSAGIIFDINSPGGTSAGLMELVDEIYAARGKKPMCAIANVYAFSAAYAIASAADEIILSNDGGVGSVGVIMHHIDYSGYFEKWGVKITPIFAGKRKNDFSPYFQLSKEAKERAQEMVNDHYKLFTEIVARNRSMSVEDVIDTEADIFFGRKAVKVKFADEVMSYEAAIGRMFKRVGVSGEGIGTYSIKSEEDIGAESTEEKSTKNQNSGKEEGSMNPKEVMIQTLITDSSYPFVEDDKGWLELGSEEQLSALLKLKTVDTVKAEFEAELRSAISDDEDQEIAELMSEIEELKTKLADSNDACDRLTFEKFVRDNDIPGDVKLIVDTLIRLKKTDEPAFEQYKKSLEDMGRAAQALGLFGESGSQLDAGDGVQSAYQRMQEIKSQIMANEKLPEPQAWRETVRRNPELYKEYNMEIRKKRKEAN